MGNSSVPSLETRLRSASLRGETTGIREVPAVSKLIDTTTCIGCKACEVACQEWNDLGIVPTKQTGTYQTLPSLDANYWNLIKFHEQNLDDGGLAWLMRKDQCMHCADPGCLRACPAPGALVQYENGIVDVNADACIGCGLCATGCPFDVPKFSAKTGKMAKCTLCVDRVGVGLEPACIKACPTGCLQFGTKKDMLAKGAERVKQLHENGFPNAVVYDPAGVGGTGVVTVLAHGDHPEWYDLPKDPHVPLTVEITKSLLRPLGLVAVFGSVVGSFGHFLGYGPKEAPGQEPAPPVAAPAVKGAREDTVVGDRIVRHALASRVIHWSVALFFFLALFSGLPIWTPIFGWMAALFGGLSVCRWLHPWAGIAFSGAALLMIAYWFKDMLMAKGDWGWLGPKFIAYFRRKTAEDPTVGKYNGGQKIFFQLVGLLMLCLLATGIVLWYPGSFTADQRQVSWPLHDAAFLLFAVSIVGHIYLGTAALPGTFRSMTRGTVSKAYARLHHPRWYRETTGEQERPTGERESSNDGGS
jgi:formate dehydrogenase beta subunit/formate dehydrogenase gamma subunit